MISPSWHQFLTDLGGKIADDGEVSGLGGPVSPAAPYLCPLPAYALISATGEEAQAFLHGQFTSDVNHLPEGELQHSAWCTAKGRIYASMLLWRLADGGYDLLVAADLLPAMIKRLKMYVLRSKVVLTEKADQVILGLGGQGATALLQAQGVTPPAEPLTHTRFPGGRVARLEGEERFLLVLEEGAAPAWWHKLVAQAQAADSAVWRLGDVVAGIPWVSLATQEAFIPQMVNFERIGGVSFHKGCYPGQEVVARTQYLGKVKRSLFRGLSPLPVAPGQALVTPDMEDGAAGQVVSGAPDAQGQWHFLAVLPESWQGHPVHLGDKGGAEVTLAPVATETPTA